MDDFLTSTSFGFPNIIQSSIFELSMFSVISAIYKLCDADPISFYFLDLKFLLGSVPMSFLLSAEELMLYHQTVVCPLLFPIDFDYLIML